MNMLSAYAFCFLLSASTVNAKVASDSPTFLMISGISAPDEMCLAVANGDSDTDGRDVVLEPCAAAVAAGDGRELWQHLPNGQIANAVGKKCVGADGEAVILTACDAADTWKAQGNGQLQLGREGALCLSQKGSSVGVDDAAAHGAVSASSTADAAAHGANMAVDGSLNTFWASELDPAGPVTITVDLGGQKKLSAVNIQWEFPARSFTVGVSSDGVKWADVYTTDSNVLSSSSISMGSVTAAKLRVVMHEAAGSFHGRAVYGMKSLTVPTTRLQSVVEDCAAAAKSTDARDKYFATFVGEFTPCSSKALRSELPSLEAARASVATVISALAAALPKISSCRAAPSLMKGAGISLVLAQLTRGDGRTNAATSNNAVKMVRDVDSQNGVDADAVSGLLQEARRVILAARGALF